MDSFEEILHSNRSTTASGALTITDFNMMFDALFPHDYTPEPICLYVTLKQFKRMAHLQHLGSLYRTHPAPKRKIRKCHMRKLHAAWKRGRAHLARVESNEAKWLDASLEKAPVKTVIVPDMPTLNYSQAE
jgi:hypothetical protein